MWPSVVGQIGFLTGSDARPREHRQTRRRRPRFRASPRRRPSAVPCPRRRQAADVRQDAVRVTRGSASLSAFAHRVTRSRPSDPSQAGAKRCPECGPVSIDHRSPRRRNPGDRGRTFAPRLRVDDAGEGSRTAAHPQLAHVGSKVVVVWDESGARGRQVRLAEIGSSASGAWTPAASAPITISGDDRGVYPAVTSVSGTPIVAWTAEAADASVIRVRRLTGGH